MSPWRCFTCTLRQCCVNMACAPIFLVAIPIYALYFCWPYMAQLPDHIHCAIVDGDNSALSRRLVMEFRSTPDLNVLQVTDNRQEAIEAMKTGAISAIVEIPKNFAIDSADAIPTAITLITNGAYLVAAKVAGAGATAPVEALATRKISSWLATRGVPYSQLSLMRMESPSLVLVPVYNTISGYLNFAVPIFFIIVFQVLMAAGLGMLLNVWYLEKPIPEILREALASPLHMLAMQMPVFLFCFAWCLFIEGPIFYLQGVNSFQNVPATLVICATFSLAVSSFACFTSLLLGPTHFVLQGLVLSALPCVFLSGNLWPAQNMPLLFKAIAWIFPSTPASVGIIRASQCGAGIGDIGFYLLHLAFLAVAYFLLARIYARWQIRHMNLG